MVKLGVEAIDDTLKLELARGNKILWENAEETKTLVFYSRNKVMGNFALVIVSDMCRKCVLVCATKARSQEHF